MTCCALLEYRGPRALPCLNAAAKSKDQDVRSTALTSLAATLDPAAFPSLIAALQDSDHIVRSTAINGLVRLRDLRAIPHLRQLESDLRVRNLVRPAIQELYLSKIQPSKYPHSWPADSGHIQLLCMDAGTFKGESFGPAERTLLLNHIQSKHTIIRAASLRALASLQAHDLVPTILKNAGGDLPLEPLVSLGGPLVVDYFVEHYQASDTFGRRALAAHLGYGDCWATPLLISLLDDSGMLVYSNPNITTDSNTAIAQFTFGSNQRMLSESPRFTPEANEAFSALVNLVQRHARTKRFLVSDNPPPVSLADEVTRAKRWWATHGNTFLAGKPVPNPGLHIPSRFQEFQAVGTAGGEITGDF